jgi:hypothetical protein
MGSAWGYVDLRGAASLPVHYPYLPAGVTGTISAAKLAIQTLVTFLTLRFGLMVGIGGGVPSEAYDIRLGDVAVSQPARTFGGVI